MTAQRRARHAHVGRAQSVSGGSGSRYGSYGSYGGYGGYGGSDTTLSEQYDSSDDDDALDFDGGVDGSEDHYSARTQMDIVGTNRCVCADPVKFESAPPLCATSHRAKSQPSFAPCACMYI